MIIATIIYSLIMAFLVLCRAEVWEANPSFESSNIAQGAAMWFLEDFMKFITIIYAIALFVIWAFGIL